MARWTRFALMALFVVPSAILAQDANASYSGWILEMPGPVLLGHACQSVGPDLAHAVTGAEITVFDTEPVGNTTEIPHFRATSLTTGSFHVAGLKPQHVYGFTVAKVGYKTVNGSLVAGDPSIKTLIHMQKEPTIEGQETRGSSIDNPFSVR
jgi:hypothetical protein